MHQEAQTLSQTMTYSLSEETTIHRLGLGAMRLTEWRDAEDRDGAIALLRRAVDLGINLIDTADSYALGANEELIAEALYPYPDHVVVATKAGQTRPSRSEWVPLGRPEYLRQQVELSLRRLRVESLKLFQLHRVDPKVPFDEQVGVLAQLRDEGKLQHIGLSEVTADQVAAADDITPITSVQNAYNIGVRKHDSVVDYCAQHRKAFLAWMPINYGNFDRINPHLDAVAAEVGARRVQVALAWLLSRSDITIPIPGTTSIRHLEENWEAASLTLSDEQLWRLNSAP